MKKMIVTLALIAPLSAVAAQKDPNGFYIGVGAGSTELDDGGFGKAITRKTTQLKLNHLLINSLPVIRSTVLLVSKANILNMERLQQK
ncbi:hypothetical protein [Vibrio atlanticus]|uniref:Uncharacterized protein n=1 Tax=Vibrio atlanticus TaxID=693153 RepID=A0ABV4KQ98_9VIBR